MLPITTDQPIRVYPRVEERVAKARADALAGDVAKSEEEIAEHLRGIDAAVREEAMRDPGACYLLKVPSIWERADYEASLTARGARFVAQEEFRRTLREGIRAALDLAQVDYCLSVAERYEEAVDTFARGIPFPDGFVELAREADQITEAVAANYEPYRRLVERQSRASSISMLLQVQMFVLGAEGEGAPALERRNGRLSDASLSRILETGDMGRLSGEIMRLMRPDRDAMGNSGSPVPSMPRGPANSRAAKRRRTALPGNSSAVSTAEIPH